MTDSEILAQSFKLSDAQELVARQHGSDSWRALNAEPQLFVADINSSCDFFTNKLGFAAAFIYGEPRFYAQVVRDGARINLRCVEQPVIDPDLRDCEQLLSASLTVATADEIK